MSDDPGHEPEAPAAEGTGHGDVRWRHVLGVAAASALVAGATCALWSHQRGDHPEVRGSATATCTADGRSYVASTTLLVTSGAGPEENETVVKMFEALIRSEAFRSQLIERLNTDGTGAAPTGTELEQMIATERPELAALLLLNVTTTDPDRSKAIAASTVVTLQHMIDTKRVARPPDEDPVPEPVLQELFNRPIHEHTPW